MPAETSSIHLPQGLRVFSFTGPSGSLSRSVNAYLLDGDACPVVIDSGYSAKGSGMGSHVSDPPASGGLLLLTHVHRDHAGDAETLSRLGFEVRFHKEEEDLYGDRVSALKPVRHIEDEEAVETALGRLTALHTPGHARGHLCFYWEKEGILFSGDLVTGEPSTWIGPPDGHMGTYLASLRRVAKLPLRLILSGHGPPVEHPAEAIETYLERRLEREAEIVRLLGKGHALPSDLTVQLYRGRGLPPQMQSFAEKTVEAHLIKLCEEGRAERLRGGGYSLT